MKVFIKYVLIIVIGTNTINLLLGKLVDKGLVSGTHTYFEEWNQIVSGDINAEVIILGSSRGKVSYDPEVFTKGLQLETFNLSFDAAPHNLQIDKFNTYLSYNKKPKILIQNIDLAHFSTLKQIPFREQILPVSEVPEVREIIKKYEPEYDYWKSQGTMKYAYDVRLFKRAFLYAVDNFDNPPSLDYNGFYPVEKPFQIDSYNLARIEASHIEKPNFIKEEGIATTLSFIKNQLDANIQVVLVWLPESERRWRLTERATHRVKNLVSEFCTENSNIAFIDLQKINLDEKNHFYDTFHLNKKGSYIVSSMIVDTINNLN